MEYTVHRLLSLRKSTVARILNIIGDSNFIETVQGKSKKINGVPVIDIENQIKSAYDKVLGLISNYAKIKSALLNTNAGIDSDTPVKRFTVAGKIYTMAELIDASDNIYGNKKHPIAFKAELLKKLKSQYAAAQNKVQARAAKVEQDIQEYLVKAAGADKQMSAEDIAKRSAMLHEDGDLHLVDPLDLKNVIEKLSSDIETFRQECDATMTEQNALTKVNIDLTNID